MAGDSFLLAIRLINYSHDENKKMKEQASSLDPNRGISLGLCLVPFVAF
jgi:hypothetical protein